MTDVAAALWDARLYLVAPAVLHAGPLHEHVPALAAAGVDLVQLREKDAEAGDVMRAGGPLVEACRRANVPVIVNDRADVAVALGADGVHVGQNDLPVEHARRIASGAIVGLSTHTRDEIDLVAAMERPPDYIAVGPVFETPTKPGRPAVGTALVRYAAERVSLPWFAIGGIDGSNLDDVIAAGARRVVVVRAITEASDPAAAARSLSERLRARPLGEAPSGRPPG